MCLSMCSQATLHKWEKQRRGTHSDAMWSCKGSSHEAIISQTQRESIQEDVQTVTSSTRTVTCESRE